ncbi:MAG: hypothetical protein ACRC6M_08780, partial [Microcystaceae cyanobacterium]
MGLPEPKLIQGCDTDCYVEPLTPRTQRTPSTIEGVPAYQTFETSKIQFTETKFKSCSDRKITITLERTTSQGYNNATVSGLRDAIEFPFVPEFKTSSIEVDLTGNFAGVYVLGISAIATGDFGENTEAELTIVDCSPFNPDFPDLEDLECIPDEFVDFGGGECEGSYLVANYVTGNRNSDGTCEIIKVRQFQEGLDCPDPPPPPPRECESTIPRDCDIRIEEPRCVDTETGDGYNNNAGFNAIVRVQTGEKVIEYLRPDKKECAEYCVFEERSINIPSCPNRPRKPEPPPFCPIPVRRYYDWMTESAYQSRQSGGFFGSIGTAIVDSFACGDFEPSTSMAAVERNQQKNYVLVALTAKCMKPVNRYLDSVQEANYQGNAFGEGCCPFDETKPDRPVCPPVDKWKCDNGVCVQDPAG